MPSKLKSALGGAAKPRQRSCDSSGYLVKPKAERNKVDELSMGITIVYRGPTIPLTYARLFATLERDGQRFGNMDLLIAASAVTAEAPLVTRNVDELSRIPELELLTY